MNNVVKRVLLTLIGIPLLFSVIFFLDVAHHLPLAVVVVVFILFGAYESYRLLSLVRVTVDESSYRWFLPPWVTAIFPIAAYVEHVIDTDIELVTMVLITLVTVITLIEIIRGADDDYRYSGARIGRQLIALLYPAFPVIYLIKMTQWDNSGWLIGLFFLLIFANDIFAYLFGMFLGKGSRNVFKVSPKKSVVGFLGGTLMTVVIGFCYLLILPETLPGISWLFLLFLFVIISITANIGDLFESVLKRHANVKDSGTLIPGRGGVLDTIDSIVFSAPFFFHLLDYLL